VLPFTLEQQSYKQGRFCFVKNNYSEADSTAFLLNTVKAENGLNLDISVSKIFGYEVFDLLIVRPFFFFFDLHH